MAVCIFVLPLFLDCSGLVLSDEWLFRTPCGLQNSGPKMDFTMKFQEGTTSKWVDGNPHLLPFALEHVLFPLVGVKRNSSLLELCSHFLQGSYPNGSLSDAKNV